jgi:hypothetical protein
MGQSTPINRELALLDVGLVIAGAARDGSRIAPHHEASLIVKRHPHYEMTQGEVCDAIVKLSAQRGLQVSDERQTGEGLG